MDNKTTEEQPVQAGRFLDALEGSEALKLGLLVGKVVAANHVRDISNLRWLNTDQGRDAGFGQDYSSLDSERLWMIKRSNPGLTYLLYGCDIDEAWEHAIVSLGTPIEDMLDEKELAEWVTIWKGGDLEAVEAFASTVDASTGPDGSYYATEGITFEEVR